MSDNEFEETDTPTYPPVDVDTLKEVTAHNAFLGSHRQEVAKLIETQLRERDEYEPDVLFLQQPHES
ncbi:MAG: hypothetical protein IIT84_03570 [Oscillospiraceae bacterium]|nr:hypothetical protein [Oscillospiraceae bacterium]